MASAVETLHILIKNDCVDALRRLLETGFFEDLNVLHKDVTPLILAIRTAYFPGNASCEMIELLLSQPTIDVNVGIDFYGTPLHMACYNCNLALVRLLLQHGANPNVMVNNGYSVIHKALDIGTIDDNQLEIIELVVKTGADLNAIHKDKTPLERVESWHYSSHFANSTIRQRLLEILSAGGSGTKAAKR